MSTTAIPSKEALEEVYKHLTPHVHQTPVLHSTALDQLVGASLLFKCENFQKMGAFKMRGAFNAIRLLNDTQKSNGVVTHSSGNFGQAVALAALKLGVTAHIVMPSNAPSVKVEAVKNYGGKVSFSEPTLKSRENESARIQKETGATLLHPSNQIEVILGNATAAMELLKSSPDLDYIFAPVGGGGLIAGTALAAHNFGTNCTVIGGEPKQADDAFRSLRSGKIETNETTDTIADGLRTNLGDINFPIIQNHVQEIIRVDEDEIISAMRLVWERMKIIIEPSSAVPVAAIFKEKERFSDKKIGVIISGGNVDLLNLPF